MTAVRWEAPPHAQSPLGGFLPESMRRALSGR